MEWGLLPILLGEYREGSRTERPVSYGGCQGERGDSNGIELMAERYPKARGIWLLRCVCKRLQEEILMTEYVLCGVHAFHSRHKEVEPGEFPQLEAGLD